MAVKTLYKDLKCGPMVIGYVCQRPSGEYWFNPKMPHRRSSRRTYDTPLAAIPRWARNMADRIEDNDNE